ncbi:anaerobic ribonucleoside-triphosphate reductase activating protein [Dermabacter sp. HSID17554]|uniref:anaerobic ribonucleoside-triphosphate reductase activating protein n=1 Tax=Dermabacter sp. HSID17554 TaxID=2419511 RepID=UPI000F889D73|nr:anaerobic ribonucleoside-triphosphate reductase activating protein [Dermabacter sp. HSID17554]RUP85799.1 anaerobic ribonucleoside-triphosphate reductase activating protein [Dermabacter sp. HSID17554]
MSARSTPPAAKDLRIAGLVPLSTVDWPGTLAATLFLQGCPWRCSYCHNRAILDPRTPGTVSWSEVRDLLARRRGLLDGVVFSGGEATMQHALIPALEEVRDLGFRAGLHTGGAFPTRIEALVNAAGGPLVDWVGFDLKAPPEVFEATVGMPVTGRGPARSWENSRRSFLALARAGVDVELRTTLTPLLAPYAPRIVEVASDLWREAGVPRHARSLVFQQVRSTGASESFACSLPEKPRWDRMFETVLERARATGEIVGVDVEARRADLTEANVMKK